jgi:hypothetical protein
VDLLPALQILGPDCGVIMEQHFAEHDVGRVHDAQVERRQPLRVLVVRAGAKLQQSPAINVVFTI